MKKESQGSYLFVIVPEHPMADSRGRVMEHRYLMSERIGRSLNRSEVVHHINGDRRDNRLANLELMTRSEHTRLHCPAFILQCVCAFCGAKFERTKRTARGKRTFCNRSCSASFNSSGNVRKRKKIPHGRCGRYRKGCRCKKCKEANTERLRRYRAKKQSK